MPFLFRVIFFCAEPRCASTAIIKYFQTVLRKSLKKVHHLKLYDPCVCVNPCLVLVLVPSKLHLFWSWCVKAHGAFIPVAAARHRPEVEPEQTSGELTVTGWAAWGLDTPLHLDSH